MTRRGTFFFNRWPSGTLLFQQIYLLESNVKCYLYTYPGQSFSLPLWTTEIDGKNLSMRADLARPDDDDDDVWAHELLRLMLR